MQGKTLIVAAFVLLFFADTLKAQVAKSEQELKTLLKNSLSKDYKVSDEAKKELENVTEASFPTLLKFAQKEKPCIAVMAGRVIANKDPNYPKLTEAFGKIARGAAFSDLANLEEAGLCRRGATFALAMTADGLKIILAMLKGDTWEKQSAIFALDDLTEGSGYPPGGVDVMKEIIPLLGGLQNAKDEVISEMSGEVLSQLTRDNVPELAKAAKKVYKD